MAPVEASPAIASAAHIAPTMGSSICSAMNSTKTGSTRPLLSTMAASAPGPSFGPALFGLPAVTAMPMPAITGTRMSSPNAISVRGRRSTSRSSERSSRPSGAWVRARATGTVAVSVVI